MARGTIEHLRPGHAGGRGFGVIAPDGGGRTVYFYRSGVEGYLFDQLRVGQRVAFEVARNPGNPLDVRAVRIQALTD